VAGVGVGDGDVVMTELLETGFVLRCVRSGHGITF
jgi:hypothetical protein